MRRCALLRGGAKKKRRGAKRPARAAVFNLRDAVGMFIPEARLRRDRISPNAFDRCVEEGARGILALDAGDAHKPGDYGARFDRRAIRFQGKSGDLRQFAEMAERVASAEKWGSTAPSSGDLPTGCVAFVGGKGQSAELSNDASDAVKETRKGGSRAMLQRAFKRYGVSSSSLAHLIAAGDVADSAETAAATEAKLEVKTTEGKRRAERRQRRLERMLGREGRDVHPCVHQGGCVSRGGAAMCPFVQYPATACVEWLRHGHCEDLLRGCCPWWHGSVADTSKREVVFSSLFCGLGCGDVVAHDNDGADGGGACNAEMLRESCAWVGALLQMFLDIIVTVMEDTQPKGSGEAVTIVSVQQQLEKAQSGAASSSKERATDVLFFYDTERCVISVERELGVSALMTDTVTASVHENGDEKVDLFDAILASELATSTQSDLARGGEYAKTEEDEQQLHEVAEERLCRVLATFHGYIGAVDTLEGSTCRIALSAPLTRWLLQRVVDDYNKKEDRTQSGVGKTLEATPQVLFEEASTVLLRSRLQMCGVSSAKEGGSEVRPHRWSALLLLQLMALLTRIVVPCGASFTEGHAETSFLFSKLLSLHIESSPSWQGHNIQARYVSYWVFLQSVLSKVALGLVRESTHMFAISRPALVDITRCLANDTENYFSKSLLRSSGWSAWTDEQMFASQQMAGYTAAGYAQFHMPAFAHCFVASALNTFLLHVLREASSRYQLRLSPVAAVFFGQSRSSNSLQECVRQERILFGAGGGGSGVQVRRGIQPYVLEALAIVAALQEENNTVLARREQLIEDFKKRREEYRERRSAEAARRKNKSCSMNVDNKMKPVDSDEAHIFEKLLPHGALMISADIVGLLFRVLFEGGGAYKALRLAASAIRGCRMLRHAAKQPMPYVVQSEKTVFKRVRHSQTGQKRLIRVRVPVLRHVDAVSNEWKRTGAIVRSVGLYLQLGEAAVAEIARMGVRMGAAGAKLVRGVCTDCVRGALVDHAVGRCLPAPTAADVHRDGSVSAAFGSRVLQGVLSLAGVGGGDGGAKRQPSHGMGAVIRERRIPPTSLLLEILVALTPFDDREAHNQYERWCGMDPQVLVSDRVLLAQQYHTARHQFGRANGVAAAVWLDVMRGGIASLSRPSTVMLEKEKEQLPQPEGFEEGAMSPIVHRERAPPPPRTLEELRHRLEHSGDENSATHTRSRQRSGHTSYIAHSLMTHAANPSVLRRMQWATLAGTLLAITDDKLAGTQKVWSRLLLRNSFIIACENTNPRERADDVQATVRIFLLTDIFCSATRAVTGVRQLPWSGAAVRDLPQYLAAQVWLTEHLQTWLEGNTDLPVLRQGLKHLPRFKAAAGLEEHDVIQTHARQLLEPFLQHPELGAKWLQASFLGTQHELLVWVIARVDKTNQHVVLSLAAWVAFLYLNGATEHSLYLYAMEEAKKQCTTAQLKALHEWITTPTDT